VWRRPGSGHELGHFRGHDRGPELGLGRPWDHGWLPAPYRGPGRGGPAAVHHGRIEDPRSGRVGHPDLVRLAELELDRLLAKQVKDRFRARGQSVTVAGKNIGYELRCAPPIPFDIEYTRDLGYAAVEYLKRVLKGDEPGGMITIQEGHMVPLPFGSFGDPETGPVRIRLVDIESSSYRVAREYMIRLDREDLQDPDKLRPIAAAAGLTPGAFRDRYGYLAGS